MTEDAAVVQWMRKAAHPLSAIAPGNGFADLRPLGELIENARVVGLGEAAHGASEFFTLKHRLVEYLVVEHGFTAIAWEASNAGGRPIDDYVRRGTGDGAAALSSQGYLAWDTEEVAALLDWLRAHNASRPLEQKVAFHGLDSGYNRVGRAAVRTYLNRVAPDRLPEVETVFAILERLEPRWPFRLGEADAPDLAQAYVGLQRLRDQLADDVDHEAGDAGASELAEVGWFVRLMLQWTGPDRGERSLNMGENLLALIERERPGTKFLVWQHNAHIGCGTLTPQRSLGDLMRERFGEAYVALALECGHGSVHTRKVDPEGFSADLVQTVIEPPSGGSLPWYLAQAGPAAFFLGLRRPPEDPQVRQWLDQPVGEHGVGWTTSDLATVHHRGRIAEQYDGLFYLNRVGPTHPTANARAAIARREKY